KFRRRVWMFVIVTVVVILIGDRWIGSWNAQSSAIIVSRVGLDIRTDSYRGWASTHIRTSYPIENPSYQARGSGNNSLGILIYHVESDRFQNWSFRIRYRTLFILAMIPWIITLIRLIRVRKRKRILE